MAGLLLPTAAWLSISARRPDLEPPEIACVFGDDRHISAQLAMLAANMFPVEAGP